MKKLLFALALTTSFPAAFCGQQLHAAETATASTNLTIVVPQGFLKINNEEILTIDLNTGTDIALFKGQTKQQSGKVRSGSPGRQGGHMSQTEDYYIAGMDAGNTLFFDDATNMLYVVQVTGDVGTTLKETMVTVN